MMIHQTLIPSKTDEILSRYRPIAPKPDLPPNPSNGAAPEKRRSPYIRNIWAHLQSRPTRARKRGRATTTSSVPPSLKKHNIAQSQTQTPPFFTLPLLSSSHSSSPPTFNLNCTVEPLHEKDLILQLKSPTTFTSLIVAPKPIRPIGSTIKLGPITPAQKAHSGQPKKPEEVEGEMESEAFPAVISDSNNRVRMVNSAYKELLGQPECMWLDSLTTTVSGKRISGEVMIQLQPGSDLTVLSNGFSCWAKIQWGDKSVDAFCDVVRVFCESKDYLLRWRFQMAK